MRVGCIIQANRYGWDGTEDYCMRKIDNKYLIEHVIEKIKNNININEIVIAVSNIEENDIFRTIAEKHNVKCYFGSAEDVLDRFINASNEMEADVIVKTLGQNCFLDIKLLKDMLIFIQENIEFDFVQVEDDFETKFTCEIFKKNMLLKVKTEILKFVNDHKMIESFLSRPMSFVKANKDKFNVKVYKDVPKYNKEYLLEIREIAKEIYNEGDSTEIIYDKQVESGNFYIERYKFAAKYIMKDDSVLDIACGSGYGTKYIFDTVCKDIIGADLDKNTISNNKKKYKDIQFKVENATNMDFQDESFNTVLSMETIEHIPLSLIGNYLLEIKRVLKKDGTFICTTPQNSNGDIPIVPWHEKEYSLKDFKEILSKHFIVEKIFGSKNGIYTDDEKGNGMMAICKKVGYK